jgi:hypothetical protein
MISKLAISLPPAARGLFSRKPPPGPPQKLFIKKALYLPKGEKEGLNKK